MPLPKLPKPPRISEIIQKNNPVHEVVLDARGLINSGRAEIRGLADSLRGEQQASTSYLKEKQDKLKHSLELHREYISIGDKPIAEMADRELQVVRTETPSFGVLEMVEQELKRRDVIGSTGQDDIKRMTGGKIIEDKPVPTSRVSEEDTYKYQCDLILDDLQHLETEHLPNKGKIMGKTCDCLHPETYLYTHSGLGRVTKLPMGSSLLTHNGRFRPLATPMRRDYSGDMINLGVVYTSFPLRITPEHPSFAIKSPRVFGNGWGHKLTGLDERELAWIKAGDLSRGDFLCFPRLGHTIDMEFVTPALAELFGWYVAEGCKDKETNRIVICLGKQEVDNIKRVVKLIKFTFGLDAKLYERPTGLHIAFCHRDFNSLFDCFGAGASHKELPDWLLTLPDIKTGAFLRGYISGDGSLSGTRITMATRSLRLAAQLRVLLYRLGVLHGFSGRALPESEINGRILKASGPLFSISVSGRAGEVLSKLTGVNWHHRTSIRPTNQGWVGDGYVFTPVEKVAREPYCGSVYNSEVAEDNTYVTLHGVLHNCVAKASRDLRRHAKETIPIAARAGKNTKLFDDIAQWANRMMQIGTASAVESGRYDDVYLQEAGTASAFRKQIQKELESCTRCSEATDLRRFLEVRNDQGQLLGR